MNFKIRKSVNITYFLWQENGSIKIRKQYFEKEDLNAQKKTQRTFRDYMDGI